MHIKSPFELAVKCRDAYEDMAIPRLASLGFFEFDARMRKSRPMRTDSLTDGWGVSNRAFLERYNKRHPNHPVENPYI